LSFWKEKLHACEVTKDKKIWRLEVDLAFVELFAIQSLGI
jgi:hypothetical protein